jgi:tyrosyl-tRNA synthetase
MNAMVPGLSGGKMSSSEPKSKVDFLDTPAEIKSKLKAAVCTPGQVEGNGVLGFVKAVLIPVQNLWNEQAKEKGQADFRGEAKSFITSNSPPGTVFSISRPEKFGGDIHVSSYEELEEKYVKEEIHPGDLKTGVTDALVKLLSPIQEMFKGNEEWMEAEKQGYAGGSEKVGTEKAVKPEGKVSLLELCFLNVADYLGEEREGGQICSPDRRRESGFESQEGAREVSETASESCGGKPNFP